MSRTPQVSIILPFLNGGTAFEPALRSILQQTESDWELLLCDDGSTDGSLELAQAIRDARVVVWSDGQSKGLAGRLNECIHRANGAFIARMDADDIAYPQRIEQQLAYLKSHPQTDLVGCRMLIFGERGEPLGKRRLPLDHAGIVANPALGFGLAHPTWMARADWFRKHLYDPKAIRYEDIELLYRSYRNSRFANLPQVLYGYRELQGGFGKRFKTRLGRIRYLQARKAEFGSGFVMRAALAESLKTVADSMLSRGSMRYSWLKRREEPLDAKDLQEWQSVLQSTSTEARREMPLAARSVNV